jgi:hypothetical protein
MENKSESRLAALFCVRLETLKQDPKKDQKNIDTKHLQEQAAS